MDREIIELALCEQEMLVLREGILYEFVAHEDCERCMELRRMGEPEVSEE
jgi:hypothetical protein